MEITERRCVCVIGDVFVDVQANGVDRLPTWNSDTAATSIEVLPGGSAANTARQLHALLSSDADNADRNADVKFISTIGNDYFGKLFKDICKKEGMNFHLEELNCPTSVCMCLSGPLDRAFVSCYSSTDAFEYRHLASEIPSNTTHLHIGGYFNLIGLHSNEFVQGCAEMKGRGITLSISTQYDAREKWSGENDILRQLFPLCDLVFVNESELEKLLPSLGGQNNVTVIETKGANGCRIYRQGVPSSKTSLDEVSDAINVPLQIGVVDIVDATGAGDAFIAGFLDKWIDEHSTRTYSYSLTTEELVNCCRRGHRIAGLNVQRLGACRQPISIQEVDRA